MKESIFSLESIQCQIELESESELCNLKKCPLFDSRIDSSWWVITPLVLTSRNEIAVSRAKQEVATSQHGPTAPPSFFMSVYTPGAKLKSLLGPTDVQGASKGPFPGCGNAEAIWDRSGTQQQEQNSPNLGTAF